MEAATFTGARARSRVHLDRAWVWTIAGLVGVTGLAFALRFAAFGRVAGDPFYDAAVRSMGQSWHNFFFGAYEPGGQVSVDKAPMDLWLQVASTKLLGFSSASLRLPEALAGALTVPLLFDTVRRLFGRLAGVLAAGVLAVLPLAVLTSRSDTMDSLMVALLVGAAWLVVRSSQTGRALPLIGAGAVVGLAFEVKLFEALLILPALVALAVLGRTMSGRRLLAGLAGAGGALVVVGLGWALAASLAPGAHPWPIGSTDGTVWNVVFQYNGLDRVQGTGAPAQSLIDPVGPLRLFGIGGQHYETYVGSALAAALAVGVAALAFAAPHLWRDGSPAGRRRRGGAAWLAVWLLTCVALFDGMGRLHLRYVEAMSPAIAGVLGVGIATLVLGSRRSRVAGVLLAVAVTVSAVLVTGPGHAPGWTVPVALGGAALAAAAAGALLAVHGRARELVAGALAVGVLAATLTVPIAATAAVAGTSQSDSGSLGAMPPAQLTALSAYLRAHQGTARYEVAMQTVARAGALIARDGRPVLMVTSVKALPLITAAQLAADVRSGQVHYVIAGRARCVHDVRVSCPPAMRWALRHGTDVSAAAGQPAGQLFRVGTAVTATGATISAQPLPAGAPTTSTAPKCRHSTVSCGRGRVPRVTQRAGARPGRPTPAAPRRSSRAARHRVGRTRATGAHRR